MTDKRGDTIAGFITGPTANIWFMHSLMTLFKEDRDGRFLASWLMALGPYIHDNRNNLVKDFMELERRRDWLFMVDNDMVFHATDVFALLEAADQRGPGIYGAPYVLENGAYVTGRWAEEDDQAYQQAVTLPSDEPFQEGVVGGGFTLIHREVFEAVGPGGFSPFERLNGEDLAFCYRAKQVGYTPWVVPASTPGHTKTIVIYRDKAMSMQREAVDISKQEEVRI